MIMPTCMRTKHLVKDIEMLVGSGFGHPKSLVIIRVGGPETKYKHKTRLAFGF